MRCNWKHNLAVIISLRCGVSCSVGPDECQCEGKVGAGSVDKHLISLTEIDNKTSLIITFLANSMHNNCQRKAGEMVVQS